VSEGLGGDIGATERMVQQWQERAADKAEKLGRMQQKIEQLSVTEVSRDGAVEITVKSNGIVQNVQLAESAANRPMAKLSAEIMRTIQAAQAKLPELMQQAVADTIGLEDSSAQHVLSEARRNFPAPPQDDEDGHPSRGGVQEMQFRVEDDDHDAPPRRQPPQRPGPPPSRPGRRSPLDFDDDDFSGGSFLR
jgi:DNA-binding protein YbaB